MMRNRSKFQASGDPVAGVIALDSASQRQTSHSEQAAGLHGWREAIRLRMSVVISLAIFALSLGVGVYQASANSIWLDEAYAVGLSQLNWATLWSYLWGIEAHMGFYYVLLRGWTWLLGAVGLAPTEFAIRLPSLICVALSAVIVYQFGRRFLGDLAGVVGALLFLTNFLVLVQGDEAREYGLETLFVCAAWYALVAALADDGHSRRWWMLYIVFGTLQIYAEVFSALILIAQVATFVCLFALGAQWRARARRSAVGMVVSVAVILRLSTPILYDALLHGSGNGWVPPAQLSDLAALFSPLGGGIQLFALLLLAIGLLELTVALLDRPPMADWWVGASARLNRLLGGRAPTLLPASRSSVVALAVVALTCWFALPILLAFSLTQPRLNLHLFNYQYFAISAPAYCLIAGLCVAVTRWRFAQVILVTVLIVFSLRLLPIAQSSANYDTWHASALWLEQRYTAGDGIVCVPDTWCAIPMDYYLFAYPSAAHFDSDSPGAWNWQQQISNPTTPEALASYAAEHDRIFLVSNSRIDFGAASAQQQQMAAATSWFSEHAWKATSFTSSTYLSTITITLYTRAPSSGGAAALHATDAARGSPPLVSWRREPHAPGL